MSSIVCSYNSNSLQSGGKIWKTIGSIDRRTESSALSNILNVPISPALYTFGLRITIYSDPSSVTYGISLDVPNSQSKK